MAASELTPFRAAALAGPLGAAMLLGGPRRLTGPSFTTISSTGGEVVWGVGFLLLAVLMLVASMWRAHHPRLLAGAYLAACVGYGLFVWAFVDAAWNSDAASFTGIVVYSWVIYLHVMAMASLPPGGFARRFILLGAWIHGRRQL